jgi:hypothetical protein
LRPVDFPPEWAAAKARVDAEPGTVVALPWYQYFSFNIAPSYQVVLNAVPLYFGGDVLISSDPGIGSAGDGGAAQERADRREGVVSALLDEARGGTAISDDLGRLGVRWVVLMKDVDFSLYEPGFAADPGLERVVDGHDLALYRVRPWMGEVVGDDGMVVGSSDVVAPWVRLDASGPARAAMPGTRGWLRGTAPVDVTRDGLLALPGGSGPLWYWPAILVLAVDLTWGVCVVTVGRRERRARTPGRGSG